MCPDKSAYAAMRSFAEATYSAIFPNWAYLRMVLPGNLPHHVIVAEWLVVDGKEAQGRYERDEE